MKIKIKQKLVVKYFPRFSVENCLLSIYYNHLFIASTIVCVCTIWTIFTGNRTSCYSFKSVENSKLSLRKQINFLKFRIFRHILIVRSQLHRSLALELLTSAMIIIWHFRRCANFTSSLISLCS